MDIQSIQQIASTSAVTELPQAASNGGVSGFADVFSTVVRNANDDQLRADEALVDFSEGKTEDVQSVVMSMVQADLSFRFFLEMRNKLTESYQELSRMQF